MLRGKKVVLLVVLSLMLVLQLVGCAEVPLSGALLLVKPPSVAQGGTVFLTGEAFKPGEKVTITIGKIELATVTADNKGKFTKPDVVIPIEPNPKATISAKGDKGSTSSTTLAVTAKK